VNTIESKPSSPNALSIWRSRLLILAAAILWSTSGFFSKAPIFDDWPLEIRGVLLAFWRAAFASLALVWMVKKVEWSWRLLPMVLIFAAMNVAYLTTIVITEASVAIWLQNTAPAWVFVIGVFFLKEKVVPRDWVMMTFAGIGLTIIIFFQLQIAGSSLGIATGVLSGITFGGVVLCLRNLRDFDAAWLIFLNHIATAALISPFVIYHGVYPQGSQWIYLTLFGMLQMGIPYFLFARGVKSISGHEAAGIALLEPLLVPVWVFLAWRHLELYQPPLLSTMIGGGLILLGLVLRYFSFRRSSPQSPKKN